jgi:NAD(P)H dehydrogenase (quinone)
LNDPRCLIVFAHPLSDSLCHRLAALAEAEAEAHGWTITRHHLYTRGFDPRLTERERQSYYQVFDGHETTVEREDLLAADVLILVFPTWWFGFPAILKGWFDRLWAPGTAYDHSPGFGAMVPRLHSLRVVLAITTMGAPRWVDYLVMWRPLRRILKRAIVGPCAPAARVWWRSLYKSEAVTAAKVDRFEARIRKDFKAMVESLKQAR